MSIVKLMVARTFTRVRGLRVWLSRTVYQHDSLSSLGLPPHRYPSRTDSHEHLRGHDPG
ncbi:hypothetical protein M404DRAFT_1006208 [Pisolithus tinctorius Marx 270]|uniref:Uncharacterized protein n=1 Tax=Pisolithus tinctorius Marx 270 TaxID=870435 RepID=A0A0C3NNF3_PISTI|nr:hypothetical protein M404DRAFT_1006208 [Pisolithus tinctorius Marx 270]